MKKIIVSYTYAKTMEVPNELITKDEEYNEFCVTDDKALIDYVIAHSSCEEYDMFTLFEGETGDYLTEF